MSEKIFCLAIAMMLSLTVSFAQAQRGGKEEGKSGGKEGSKQGNKENKNSGRGQPAGKPPGGNWSESKQQPKAGHNEAGHAGAENEKHNNPANGQNAAAGAAVNNRNEPKATGAQGAAAGAAAANRNEPKASGAAGAAAGAAAANRNEPKASGASGAAAGAAAANRNEPKASGAAGVAAGAAAANRREPQATGADAAAGYAAVRSSFDRHDLYGQAWHESNPNIWRGANWPAGSEWAATPWTDVASHAGYGSNPPLSFDYGTNVTCVNGTILQDGKEIGTAEEFSQEAFDLAQAGSEAKTSPDEKWLPLGVFAMVQNEQQHPHLVLQIAINEAGNLRGNYTDTVTDSTQPILGAVDQKTQRAAWTVGANSNAVLEAGLSNLTEGHAPALFHKNGKTDPWILVRLPQPQ
jgi:hypothetical protein